jgi:hypothetical protein
VLVDFPLERVVDHRLGACRIPLAHEEVGELPEDLAIPGIERARTLEADLCLVEAAFVLISQGQAEERVLMLVVARERIAIRRDRVLRTVRLLVEIAEEHVALDDLRSLASACLTVAIASVDVRLDR